MFYGSFPAPAKVSTFPELSCLAISPSLNGELLSLGLREFSKVGALKEKPSLAFAKLSNVRVRPLARAHGNSLLLFCLLSDAAAALTRQFDVNDGGRREKAQRPILPLRALL